MRAAIAVWLTDTCTIQRRTLSSDGLGGQTETWTTLVTVACRITVAARRPPQEQVYAERVTSEGEWLLTLPPGTDVQGKDRISVANGPTLEVTGVLPYSPALDLGRHAVCRQIGG